MQQYSCYFFFQNQKHVLRMPELSGPGPRAAPRAAMAKPPAKKQSAWLAPKAKIKLAPTPKAKIKLEPTPQPAPGAVWKSLSPREPQQDQPGCMDKSEPLKMKAKETEKEKNNKAKPEKARATTTVKKKDQVMK